MRKLFSFLMLAMVFAFASCMKEEVDLGSGSEETIRFSVNLPQQGMLSRAAFSDPNLSDNPMRVFLYVMYEGSVVDEQMIDGHVFTSGGVAKPATFDLRLVTGKYYTVAVWADFGDEYYTVSTEEVDEKTIPTVEMVTDGGKISGSNNARDAYFAVKTVNFESANASESMTLKRPFGLVRIQTLDYEEDAVVNAGLLPTAYEMTVAAQTKMNLFNGELMGDDNSLTISGEVTDVATSGELSFDYFFAPAEVEGNAEEQQGKLHNFTVKYSNEANPEVVSYDFKNIPVRRNYKTNISGNILTKKGNISVKVEQDWAADDIDEVIYEVNTVDEIKAILNKAAENPATAPEELNFIVTSEMTEEVRLGLPAIASNIVLNFEKGFQAGKDFRLSGTDFTGHVVVDLANPNETNPAISSLHLPNGSITLKSGNYNTMQITTKDNTFRVCSGVKTGVVEVFGGSVIVEKGATVQGFQFQEGAGNVKLYGNVGFVQDNTDGAYKFFVALGEGSDNGNSIHEMMQKTWLNGGIILTKGEYNEGIIINKPGFVLAGEGETSEIKVNNNINITADNVTVKNLTVKSTSGDAIYTETSDITLNVEEVTVNKSGGATCIRVSDAEGVILNVKNSNLIIPKNSMRGINFYDLVEGDKCVANVDNTHIGPKAETMGYGDYNDEQNAVFKGLSDTRGIGVGANVSGLEVNIRNNSVIEGIFYAVNVIPAAGPVDVNVENSTLDGRCAFNLWGRNENGTNTFSVKNSKLVGRNPFGGSTESFATIVFNFGRGSGFSEPKNNHVIVKDSEIYCYNNPETPTNEQLAADMRSWDTNTLELRGNTVIYDRSASSRLEYAVELASSDNTCIVDETVKFLDRNGEPKNKPIVKQ